MARVMVPVVDGVEEMEVVIVVDTLRRAGWEAVLVGVGNPDVITCSRLVRLLSDASWGDIEPDTFDVLVIPGGRKGVDALVADGRIPGIVKDFVGAGKFVCAICAGPLVLQAAGVLCGRKATCHPGVRAELVDAVISDNRVEIDGAIITSQGPGTAMEFALAIVKAVDGPDASNRIVDGLVI
jgi:DJ-1 family protein